MPFDNYQLANGAHEAAIRCSGLSRPACGSWRLRISDVRLVSQLALGSLVGKCTGGLGERGARLTYRDQFRLFTFAIYDIIYLSLPIVFVVHQVVGAEDS